MAYRIPLDEGRLKELQAEIVPLTVAFELIKDHVIITDANANILYANTVCAEVTGFSLQEMIGKTPADLWGGHMPNEFYGDMWHRIKVLKQPFSGEVRNTKKDGTVYWQELRIFPVLGDDGEARFFIGIEPDITGRKIAEGAFKERYEEVDRLNKHMVGRELRMAEMKKKMEAMRRRLEEIDKS